MKYFNKNIGSLYLMFRDANNLYGWTMSQKLHVDNFKWEKNTRNFYENKILYESFYKKL